MHDGRGRLIHHHLILVPQAALDEVKQRAVVTVKESKKRTAVNNAINTAACIESLKVHSPSLRLVQQLAGDADEHAVGERRLEARLGELVEHLGDGEAVVLPEVIQQAQRMVLESGHTKV